VHADRSPWPDRQAGQSERPSEAGAGCAQPGWNALRRRYRPGCPQPLEMAECRNSAGNSGRRCVFKLGQHHGSARIRVSLLPRGQVFAAGSTASRWQQASQTHDPGHHHSALLQADAAARPYAAGESAQTGGRRRAEASRASSLALGARAQLGIGQGQPPRAVRPNSRMSRQVGPPSGQTTRSDPENSSANCRSGWSRAVEPSTLIAFIRLPASAGCQSPIDPIRSQANRWQARARAHEPQRWFTLSAACLAQALEFHRAGTLERDSGLPLKGVRTSS